MTMQDLRRKADVFVEVDLVPTEIMRADLSSTYRPLLAEILAGKHRGRLIVFAVRQAEGVSTLAVKMAQFLIHHLHDGLALAFIGAQTRDMAEGLLAAEAEVDLCKLKDGKWTGNNWRRLAEAAPRLANKNVYISDFPGASLKGLQDCMTNHLLMCFHMGNGYPLN